ncbi:MAG: hypothetical protein AAGA85_25030, partial [Bacteroidota bacterium]
TKVLTGKLTLKKVAFKGKNGHQLIPSTQFGYDLEGPSWQTSFRLGNVQGNLLDLGEVQDGDIVRITKEDGSSIYCAYHDRYSFGNRQYHDAFTMISGEFPRDGSYHPVTVKITKNPSYNREFRDLWGSFKSDYWPTENNNLDRLTTEFSAKNVDVWSLRKVVNPLGSTMELDYESDTYRQPTFGRSFPYLLGNVSFDGTLSGYLQDVQGGLPQGNLRVRVYVEEQQPVGVGPGGADVNLPTSTVGVVHEFAATLQSQNDDYVRLQINANGKLNSNSNILQANLAVDSDFKYGGGVRVKSISLTDNWRDVSTTTKYGYAMVDQSNPSSGMTSYEPILLDQAYKELTEAERVKVAQAGVSNAFKEILAYSRFIPGPGVSYENVSVLEEVRQQSDVHAVPGHTEYEFQVFEPHLIDLRTIDLTEHTGQQSGVIQGEPYVFKRNKKITLRNLASAVGSLKSLRTFDAGDRLISETVNRYLVSDLHVGHYGPGGELERRLDNFDHLGVIQESYASGRFQNNANNEFEVYGALATIESYPNIQLATVTNNHRSGVTQRSYNVAFDPVSGQTLEVVQQDPYGRYSLGVLTPAYTIYPGMRDRNMLTQEAQNTSWRIAEPTELVDPTATIINPENISLISILGSSATTWSNDVAILGDPTTYPTDIWRPESSYVWIGDGEEVEFNGATLYDEFNFASVDNPNWQKTSTITLYDVNSNALEAEDLNAQRAATKMDIEDFRVLATVVNAGYQEFAFSGAEDGLTVGGGPIDYGGGVYQPHASRRHKHGPNRVANDGDDEPTHTGLWSIRTTGSGRALQYDTQVEANRMYRVSVWVWQGGAAPNGPRMEYQVGGQVFYIQPQGEWSSRKSGEWYLYEGLIPAHADDTNLSVWVRGSNSNTVYYDDFRMHPVNGQMTSYVYNSWGELSDVLDANNLFTHYEYDDMGRLRSVFKEALGYGSVKVSENTIHYARQND